MNTLRSIIKRVLGRKLTGKVRNIKRRIVKRNVSYALKNAITISSVDKVSQKEIEKKIFSKQPSLSPNLDKLDIAFIVPAPIEGSGGHRGFFRAIRHLKNFGHDMTVYYTQTSEHPATIKKRVSDFFYSMHDINFIRYQGETACHDVCFATWWETVYDVYRNLDKIAYPFYFVQDFEPMFMPMSGEYILAEATYNLGFTHVCSGRWCSDLLAREYNAEADYFLFPINKDVYNSRKARTKQNKNILFFAKPEMSRRCYELGVMALQKFHELRPDVEIIFYGSNHVDPGSVPFPVTMKGLLPTIGDLANMYHNADLGLVFSTTNPSLVPYEMMACGCPVADINYSNAISKYGYSEDNIFLLDINPYKMGEQLATIIDDEDVRNFKAISAAAFTEEYFVTEAEMARKIENIIKAKVSGKAVGQQAKPCCAVCGSGTMNFYSEGRVSGDDVAKLMICSNCSAISVDEQYRHHTASGVTIPFGESPRDAKLLDKALDFLTLSRSPSVLLGNSGSDSFLADELYRKGCRPHSLQYGDIGKSNNQLVGKIDLFVYWDVLEFENDPYKILNKFNRYATGNSVVFLRTVLYEPSRITEGCKNFFNAFSLDIFLKRLGFEVKHREFLHEIGRLIVIAQKFH